MSVLPRDMTDLYLAPVVLALDERISELATLDVEALSSRVALASDLPDWTPDQRSAALLAAVGHLIELHDWVLSKDPRGLRVSHGDHTLVLATPANFAAYVHGTSDANSDAE